MSIELESAKRINNLKQGIEATTGETYNDLTEGVQALKDGYKQGGEPIEPGKPYIDTSKITNFYYFAYRNRFNDVIDKIDTSNGTVLNFMFSECNELTAIPQLDTSNGTNFANMFKNCKTLTTIPQLDTSNGTYFSNMFYGCTSLETVSLTTAKSDLATSTFQNCTALKNITIGEGWEVNIYLHYSNELTVESLHGMIENFADLTGLTAKTFQIGATNIAKIDEEHINMLKAKNWNYS